MSFSISLQLSFSLTPILHYNVTFHLLLTPFFSLYLSSSLSLLHHPSAKPYFSSSRNELTRTPPTSRLPPVQCRPVVVVVVVIVVVDVIVVVVVVVVVVVPWDVPTQNAKCSTSQKSFFKRRIREKLRFFDIEQNIFHLRTGRLTNKKYLIDYAECLQLMPPVTSFDGSNKRPPLPKAVFQTYISKGPLSK